MGTERDRSQKISKLTHRIQLCSMNDVIVNANKIDIVRKEVFECWADIYAVRGTFKSRQGYVIRDPNNEEYRSHVITIRDRRDIDFTGYAWIYEKRMKSQPRWYKILSVADIDETGIWLEFEVRLVEQSDKTVAPVPSTVAKVSPFLPHSGEIKG